MPKPAITPERAQYILDNYLKESSVQIAKRFGISKAPVLKFLKQHDLSVPKEIVSEWIRRKSVGKPLTESQIKYIHKNIHTKSIKEIAKHLKRCNSRTGKEIRALGYSDFIDQRSKDSCFQKGNIPPSAGKKIEEYMNPEQLANFRKNQYKKNQIPHNAHPVGTETKRTDAYGRTYVFIKVEGERTMLWKHRVVWEQHHGKKIPDKHNIIFKDGNTMNVTIDNLECISNAELRRRNSTGFYPKEIQELYRLQGQITRQINKYNKENGK